MTDWQRKTDEALASDASTGSNGQIAAVEMLRRVKVTNVELRQSIDDLKTTLQREEVAIKRLTGWLVGMTAALLVLTVALVGLTVMLLKHGG